MNSALIMTLREACVSQQHFWMLSLYVLHIMPACPHRQMSCTHDGSPLLPSLAQRVTWSC